MAKKPNRSSPSMNRSLSAEIARGKEARPVTQPREPLAIYRWLSAGGLFVLGAIMTLVIQTLYTTYVVEPRERVQQALAVRLELRTQVVELVDSWSVDVWRSFRGGLTETWKTLPPMPSTSAIIATGKMASFPPDVAADVSAAYQAIQDYNAATARIPPISFGDDVIGDKRRADVERLTHSQQIFTSRGIALGKAMWAMNSIESEYDLSPTDGFNRFVRIVRAAPGRPVASKDTFWKDSFYVELYRGTQDTIVKYVFASKTVPLPATVVGYWPARCNHVSMPDRGNHVFACNGVVKNLPVPLRSDSSDFYSPR
ncbi:MAG: hypothetical protein JWM27_3101 [Gemmatimonadetes bacterium]|nr:hypothetical protein [Gemmatimonadota bacterium]